MKYIRSLFLFLIFFSGREYPLLNQPVPNFSGITLTGTKIDSSYFKDKVTVVNFWSLGCRPCMEELPFLNRLDSIIHDSSFQMLSIAPHSRERLAAYNSEKKSQYSNFRKASGSEIINFNILPESEVTKKSPDDNENHLTLDHDGNAISKKFEVDGYPMTFLIDKSGIIRKIHFGYPMEGNDSAYKSVLVSEIKTLLK